MAGLQTAVGGGLAARDGEREKEGKGGKRGKKNRKKSNAPPVERAGTRGAREGWEKENLTRHYSTSIG